jgi:multiple sugar transport system ATP-binding protein
MAPLRFVEVSKVYPNGVEAVSNLTFDVEDGEFVVLVGPSGCGKTTALRMVAGLEDVTDGAIEIGGQVVNDLSPRERDIAMVFQNYALYPHMTAFNNIAFGLRQRRMPKAEIEQRVKTAARTLGLEELLHKRPRTLSGGQRQRVAMGRAIVREPRAFLMDEPLSNLDAKLRVEMRVEILHLQRRLGVTTMYVTHDQTEAMTMGDRVAVMRGGVLQQAGPPQSLYNSPANLFVAEVIGSPKMNLFAVTVERDDHDGLSARFGRHLAGIPSEIVSRVQALSERVGGTVVMGIRPEDLAESSDSIPENWARLQVTPEVREDVGSDVYVHFGLGIPSFSTGEPLHSDVVSDSGGPDISRIPFCARLGRTTQAKEGVAMCLALNPSRLYFFDQHSGLAL